MLNMLKKGLVILPVLALVVYFSACGSGSKGDKGDNATSPSSADTVAPSTAISASSPYTLTCTDTGVNISGATTAAAGCSATYYAVATTGSNPTATFTAYSAAVTVASTETIYYYSVDAAGNKESLKSK